MQYSLILLNVLVLLSLLFGCTEQRTNFEVENTNQKDYEYISVNGWDLMKITLYCPEVKEKEYFTLYNGNFKISNGFLDFKEFRTNKRIKTNCPSIVEYITKKKQLSETIDSMNEVEKVISQNSNSAVEKPTKEFEEKSKKDSNNLEKIVINNNIGL